MAFAAGPDVSCQQPPAAGGAYIIAMFHSASRFGWTSTPPISTIFPIEEKFIEGLLLSTSFPTPLRNDDSTYPCAVFCSGGRGRLC